MPNDADNEWDLGLAALTSYAQLYPSITERVRTIGLSSDPAIAAKIKVLLHAAEQALRGQVNKLVERYGLTPTEARITQFLGRGGSVKDYAEKSSTSESTVRVHLKAIFAKTGVHRQAELVRLVTG